MEGRINAIQVYGRDSDVARSGQCAAINVRHWDHKLIHRGDTLAVPGYFSSRRWYVCKVRLLDREGLFIRNGTRLKFHTGTSEAVCGLHLTEGDAIRRGGECLAQLRLEEPLVAGVRDRFILRTLTPVRTVGGGTIVEGIEQRLKRTSERVREDLKERAAAVTNDTEFVKYCVKTAAAFTARPADLSVRTQMLPGRVKAILADLLKEGSIIEPAAGIYVHRDAVEKAAGTLLKTVGDFHAGSPESPGMTRAALLESSGLKKPVFETAVELLGKQGKLVERNARLALAGHRPEFTDSERRLLDSVEALFRRRPFNPPDADAVALETRADAKTVQRMLRILREQERLVQVEGDLMFHHEAVERARKILTDFLAREGRLESVKFKYLLDTTRKFAIPLLDYFDKVGVTLRRGNTRHLKTAGDNAADA
jgi:selenocysteine-specific elongation factor